MDVSKELTFCCEVSRSVAVANRDVSFGLDPFNSNSLAGIFQASDGKWSGAVVRVDDEIRTLLVFDSQDSSHRVVRYLTHDSQRSIQDRMGHQCCLTKIALTGLKCFFSILCPDNLCVTCLKPSSIWGMIVQLVSSQLIVCGALSGNKEPQKIDVFGTQNALAEVHLPKEESLSNSNHR
ncbi:hypothetical protein J6590_063809 [Homalodisca vitripennis]|nr:hypothetical protein J6590_063809 [Homalodisca vitripennis]